MTEARPNWLKLLGQMAAGAIFGAGATAAALYLLDGRGLDLDEPGQVLALIVGMIYLLVGLVVGLGAIAPNTAAPLLNVEDADELREERPRIGQGAIGCSLIGIFLLTLAAMPPDGASGLISREAAAVVAIACIAGLVLMTVWTNRGIDELTRQVSMESGTIAMQALMVVIGAWAALAHLGFVGWIDPLVLIAGIALLQMCAIFWVCGKRGLLNPR